MMQIVHAGAYCGIALLALTWLGNIACRLLFWATGSQQAILGPAGLPHAGKVIGALERLLVGAGVIVQSWEIIAAVVALKTIARFKELDNQIKAEYFLIGSLFSLAWAVAVSGGWLAYDHRFGADLRYKGAQLVGFKDRQSPPQSLRVQPSQMPGHTAPTVPAPK
ncbi:hypothetical protein [Novosphingobium pokkalii]|uniref:Uncharacterized protein n=1 Tax=Novosphingobium pokkalii TaxID=1770194 RepID=A0ABV7V325_9SPHN|nr:hypothetical protein [Novosphingobium pokkalii]GHC90195.1 hypothetical protein GCM10019060_14380 [Novosphingobium pokkalii]